MILIFFGFSVFDLLVHFCILSNQESTLLHFQDVLSSEDTFLHLDTLAIQILASSTHSHHHFISCGMAHRNEYYPNKTIRQYCSKICIWIRYTPYHAFNNSFSQHQHCLQHIYHKLILQVCTLWLLHSIFHNPSYLQSKVPCT